VAVIAGRMSRDANSPLKAYIHQHAWLQYASVALTAAAALYSEHHHSVDAQHTHSATQLYETNIQTTINYFTHRTAVDHPQPGLSLLSVVCVCDLLADKSKNTSAIPATLVSTD